MFPQAVSNMSYFCCYNDLHALRLPGDQAMDALTIRLPLHIGLLDSATIAILCAPSLSLSVRVHRIPS